MAELPILGPIALAQLAREVGITSEGAVAVAVALALTESGGVPAVVNQNTDEHRTKDYGLWQINTYWHPQYADRLDWLLTPLGNATAMAEVSKMGTDWSAWDGSMSTARYKGFMAAAIDAATGPAGTESLWDIPGAMGDKLDGTIFGDVPEALGAFFAAVTDVGWWKRVALGLAGVIVILAAAALIAKDSLLPPPLAALASALPTP